MALINHRTHEIHFKIVYYGPGLCGKTTNLRSLHDRLPPERRGKMISIATDQERTLFFDFLPIDLGHVNGFLTRFHLYTVPGQVYYKLSRRAVLQGVDGLVFVADSHPAREAANRESLADLNEHLRTLGITGPALARIPWVFQWNKRDHAVALPIDRLRRALNAQGWPEFEAVASEGKGVSETLRAACKAVLARLGAGTAPATQAVPVAGATVAPPAASVTPGAAPAIAPAAAAAPAIAPTPAIAPKPTVAPTPVAASAAAPAPVAAAMRPTPTALPTPARRLYPASTRTTAKPAAKPATVVAAATPGRAWPRPARAMPPTKPATTPRAPDAGWSPQSSPTSPAPGAPARIVSVPGAPPSIVVPDAGQTARSRTPAIGVATATEPRTQTDPDDPARP